MTQNIALTEARTVFWSFFPFFPKSGSSTYYTRFSKSVHFDLLFIREKSGMKTLRHLLETPNPQKWTQKWTQKRLFFGFMKDFTENRPQMGPYATLFGGQAPSLGPRCWGLATMPERLSAPTPQRRREGVGGGWEVANAPLPHLSPP